MPTGTSQVHARSNNPNRAGTSFPYDGSYSNLFLECSSTNVAHHPGPTSASALGPYKCKDCKGKITIYKRPGDLKRHYNEKHSLNPPRFPCDVCPHVSKRRDNLNKHITTCHGPNSTNPRNGRKQAQARRADESSVSPSSLPMPPDQIQATGVWQHGQNMPLLEQPQYGPERPITHMHSRLPFQQHGDVSLGQSSMNATAFPPQAAWDMPPTGPLMNGHPQSTQRHEQSPTDFVALQTPAGVPQASYQTQPTLYLYEYNNTVGMPKQKQRVDDAGAALQPYADPQTYPLWPRLCPRHRNILHNQTPQALPSFHAPSTLHFNSTTVAAATGLAAAVAAASGYGRPN